MSLINLITVSKSTILGRISPVQIFAYHSPKLWTNRFVHVNVKSLCISNKFIPSVWDSKLAQLCVWLIRFPFQFLLP